MGGSKSHEFHYPTSIGEDILYICKSCKYAINKELTVSNNITECIKCGKKDLTITPGIEVLQILFTYQFHYTLYILIKINSFNIFRLHILLFWELNIQNP